MSIFIVTAKKLVTVSEKGTINFGAMVVHDRKIIDISTWERIKNMYGSAPVLDFSDYVICPSLVDCHTHLLEFAPPTQFPITKETHLLAGKAILLNVLCSGITAVGEHVCGNPIWNTSITNLTQAVQDVPLDISFAATSISLGFKELIHFTSVTESEPVQREKLVRKEFIEALAAKNEFGGANIFINATPANFKKEEVPNAGKIIFSQRELTEMVSVFHSLHKKIGTHVAGERGIQMALEAKFDVLHHAPGITNNQIIRAAKQNTMVVAAPLGGTHLPPNTIEEVIKMSHLKMTVAISTAAFLPPYEKKAVALPIDKKGLIGPEALMAVAHPYMQMMMEMGYDENQALALLTLNPAKVLGKENEFGSLEVGKDANFIIAEGIPGIEIVNPNKIKAVYFRGKNVISRV